MSGASDSDDEMLVAAIPGSPLERWESTVLDAVLDAMLGIRPGRQAVTARHSAGSVRWIRLDDVDESVTMWAAQVDGRAPVGSHIIATAVGEVGVWRHPNDPALPGLRTALDPGRGPSTFSHSCRWTGQRCASTHRAECRS